MPPEAIELVCSECGKTPSCEKEIVEKYAIPFVCSGCGNIHMHWRALNGIVFIWQKPLVEKVGNLFVPEVTRENFKSQIGVVLSAGDGIVLERTGEFKKCPVKVGDVVKFDNSTPWETEIEVGDKVYKVKNTNMLNINAVAI